MFLSFISQTQVSLIRKGIENHIRPYPGLCRGYKEFSSLCHQILFMFNDIHLLFTVQAAREF